ncbi:hypothetical protein OM960_16080 [Defluviimonas sp. CAU 1641]|uniref:DUF998 domain-containing protein n=2 Tax=Defluviimonas salinarum TaxID=2992147 RepID=A0ABT3J5X5_9RHOB|nr:hypothetical protein [Defluviimonas salinarum]
MSEMTSTNAPAPPLWRWIVRFAGAFPLAVLIVSFLMLCAISGTVPLWGIPVHEDGERSFLQTVFYFEHATREWPLDLLLGAAIGGAAALGLAPRRGLTPRRAVRALVAVSAVILAGTLVTVGPVALLDNLLQSHTRPTAELEIGSHWYFHFLGQIALLLSVLAIGLTLRAASAARPAGSAWPVILIVGAVFAGLSLAFGAGTGLAATSVLDPVYLGHQAREVATNALVTIPLGFFVCARLAETPSFGRPNGPGIATGGVIMLAALGLAGYIAHGALTGGAMEEAQSTDLRVLIFPHFFEHMFTYAVASLTAAAVFAAAGRR